MKKRILYHYFSDDDFLSITDKIKETEKITSGEIRVSIKEDKPSTMFKFDAKKMAEAEFQKLKMDETVDRTGILILIVLKEKAFYILADKGIDDKVDPGTWDSVRNEIQGEFRIGHYTQGIIRGIEIMGEILSEHFPIKPEDTNELSNKVVVD